MTPKAALFSRESDLTGLWSGEYWAAGGGPPTPFSAYLTDSAGSIIGATLEPNTFAHPGLIELAADISGARGELSIRFTKLYRPAPGVYREPIFLSGTVDPNFTMIEGEWACRVTETLAGRFVLVRVSRGAPTAEVRQNSEFTTSPGKSSRPA